MPSNNPPALQSLASAQTAQAALDLADAWRRCRDGDRRSFEFLFERFRYLVRKTLPHAAPGKLNDEDLKDVLAAGDVGLAKAIDRFDPARRVKFETFAIALIRGEERAAFRKCSPVPRSLRDRQKAFSGAEERALAAHQRPPTRAEVAAAMGLEEEAVFRLTFEAGLLEIASLDEPARDACGDHFLPGPLRLLDMLRADGPDPEARALLNEQRERLEAAIAALPPAWAYVIRRYYSTDGPTLAQIAREMGLSHARPAQIHRAALLKLAGLLSAEKDLLGG